MSSKKKPVKATDVATGAVEVYPSVADTARCFGVKDEHRRRVLRGERKICCGRRWQFADQP